MMNRMRKSLRWMLLVGIFTAGIGMRAQAPRTDLALTFTADRTNPVYGANHWLEGGSIELGTNAWHGLGAAARVTGLTTSAMGNQAVPLNLVLATFGLRYRRTYAPAAKHSISLYGEALFGEANGFKSLFPVTGGTSSSANTFALQIGGGVDYSLGRHFAYRVVEADWTRTQFQNATTNVQNHMQLSSGVALRF
jgi:hypothetical protein